MLSGQILHTVIEINQLDRSKSLQEAQVQELNYNESGYSIP